MAVYEIRVKERLDRRWSGWFDGLQITSSENGVAALSGEIVDQAALVGDKLVRAWNLVHHAYTTEDVWPVVAGCSQTSDLPRVCGFATPSYTPQRHSPDCGSRGGRGFEPRRSPLRLRI